MGAVSDSSQVDVKEEIGVPRFRTPFLMLEYVGTAITLSSLDFPGTPVV